IRRSPGTSRTAGPGSASRRCHGPAVVRPLPSRREGAGQDLPSTAPELGSEAVYVRIEGLLEFLPCDLGPEGAEVAERLDPPAAPVLVMPEIQVRTSADLLRRDTASNLHEPESDRPYSRLTMVTSPPGLRKQVKSHASVIFAHAPPGST